MSIVIYIAKTIAGLGDNLAVIFSGIKDYLCARNGIAGGVVMFKVNAEVFTDNIKFVGSEPWVRQSGYAH